MYPKLKFGHSPYKLKVTEIIIANMVCNISTISMVDISRISDKGRSRSEILARILRAESDSNAKIARVFTPGEGKSQLCQTGIVA